MTAIRTIEYTASPSGVKPIAPQDAGVRGEHKATNVVFNLDASLIKPEYKYRFEYVDGFSGFDTTEFVQPVGSTVSILLPVEWTAGGGCGTLRLCIVALDSQSNEEQTIYTFPASLLFAERETGGECNYKKGLSALIDSAGKATDAANEAAENANAAADRVDESVSGANTAAANANRAAASADASAATASAAAGGAQEAKEAADTAASGANTAAEQARTAAASANTAAGTASTAASNANAVADAVQAKLDAGELKGEKGDTGPQGPQGVSGVYVGGGEMPEGYTVQVDPTGDMLCYTAGESDSRYANVLTGAASGPVAALEDVSPTGALRRAAVLGATAETGEGDKGPDNPYTLAGVQPTKVTVCGKNLLPVTRTAEGTYSGVTITPLEGGLLKLSGTCTYNNTCPVFGTQPVRLDGALTATVTVQSGTAEFVGYNLVQYNGDIGGLTLVNMKTKEHHFQRTCMASGFNIRMDAGTVFNDYVFGIQLEKGDTATPYEPYTGQTITLPALASLYGDGTVCDEYDVVSGVETRRWKRVVFDGTENWGLSRTESGNNRYFIRVPDAVAYNLLSQIVCSHWPSIGPGQTWQDKTGITLSLGNADKNIWIYDPRFAQADLPTFKAWLAAQYAAGTPVTVVYQLDAPAVTQHDPARILPPAPVCRVFADAGGVDVGYNRDINIAFEQQQAEYIAQIKALDARIAKLETGQPAEPMT